MKITQNLLFYSYDVVFNQQHKINEKTQIFFYQQIFKNCKNINLPDAANEFDLDVEAEVLLHSITTNSLQCLCAFIPQS